MRYTVIYNLCIVVSCMFEIYFALSFYKAFHEINDFFQSKVKFFLCYFCFVVMNIVVNLQQNSIFNVSFAAFLYLFIALFMFTGDLRFRIVHWIILIFLGASAEMIFSLLQSLPVDVPVDRAFENEFFMVGGMLAVKLIYFLLLSIVKQFSRYSTEKLEWKMFGNYIMIPFATLGVMFAIPYVRRGGQGNTVMDLILLLFYMLMLLGNVSLFYMFSRYSKIKEQQMLQEISKTKYKEMKRHYDRMERLDEKHRELIHNTDHYLRQIGIYADKNEMEEIKRTLSDLQIELRGEQETICANDYLNSILADFRDRAEKEQIRVEMFVEAGFKIEFVKEIDLTVILGNLFDNAMEAAKKCDQGKVCVTFFMQNGGALSVMRIENNYKELPQKKDGSFLSTKKEQGVHGIGIKNVHRIVDRYNGYMQQEYSGGVFETTLIIPLS